MKIEIGESLTRSWLRHIKGCQFAELNWKASPMWPNTDLNCLEALYLSAKTMMPEAFGKNELSQLLKQAEVDVLGLSIKGQTQTVYMVDIAYHAGGLNYGGKDKTKARIFKKMVRSVLLGKHVFPSHCLNVCFASPFVNHSHQVGVEEAFKLLNEWLGEAPNVLLNCYLNNDFQQEILNPVFQLNSDIADTSELFLRAWQLASPFVGQPKAASSQLVEKTEQREAYQRIENKEAVLIAALYLAKYGHVALNLGNQGEAIIALAARLDVKPNTLKNQRDFFDSHVENSREGWKKPLDISQQQVLDKYGCYSETELRKQFL